MRYLIYFSILNECFHLHEYSNEFYMSANNMKWSENCSSNNFKNKKSKLTEHISIILTLSWLQIVQLYLKRKFWHLHFKMSKQIKQTAFSMFITSITYSKNRKILLLPYNFYYIVFIIGNRFNCRMFFLNSASNFMIWALNSGLILWIRIWKYNNDFGDKLALFWFSRICCEPLKSATIDSSVAMNRYFSNF